MTSSFKVMQTIWRGAQKRMQALQADGRTIALAELRPGERVVRIALGFGDEFWRVDDGFRIDMNNCRLEGGQIVLRDGEPAADVDAGKIEAIVGSIETVRFKT